MTEPLTQRDKDMTDGLAHELIGTAGMSTPETMAETRGFRLDTVTFDSIVFECDGCGWWCSTDELNNDDDDSLCDECVDSDWG